MSPRRASHTYVSMIRGINVGGHKRLSMQQLRDVYESLSFEDPKSYVQSGNVVFGTHRSDPARLALLIRAEIEKSIGYSVAVVIRNRKEIQKVAENNPFLGKRRADPTKCHVTFLAQSPKASDVRALHAPPGSSDEFIVTGEDIYVHCPDGYSRTKLHNNFFEKKLGVAATSRTWKTVLALRDLAQAHGGTAS